MAKLRNPGLINTDIVFLSAAFVPDSEWRVTSVKPRSNTRHWFNSRRGWETIPGYSLRFSSGFSFGRTVMKGLLRPHAGHLFMEQAPERELLLSLSSFLPAAFVRSSELRVTSPIKREVAGSNPVTSIQ